MEPLRVIGRIAREQDGVVTATQALAAGLSRTDIRDLCRAGRWRRLAIGTYLTSGVGDGNPPRLALIRAAVQSLGPGTTAVLGTAAEVHGIAGLRRSEEIHLSVADPRAQRTSDPRIVVHQLVIPHGQVTSCRGIPSTTPVATVADVISRVDRYSAVCVLDSALNRQLISNEEFGKLPALIRGRRGAVAARRHLVEADGRSQSPLETRARLRCVDGEVPPDVLQVDVRDLDGYLLGVGDLGWRKARVIAEADGAGPHTTHRSLDHAERRAGG